jgi:hypothetical protein
MPYIEDHLPQKKQLAITENRAYLMVRVCRFQKGITSVYKAHLRTATCVFVAQKGKEPHPLKSKDRESKIKQSKLRPPCQWKASSLAK